MKAKQITEAVLSLKQNGYAILHNFLQAGRSAAAIAEINRLIDGFTPSVDEIALFGDNKQMKSKYFFESADKVSFFFEQKAWVDGELIAPKRQAINKIGHALHEHNQIFKSITYGEGVWDVCQQMGIREPTVVQSMSILKPPTVGGIVKIHQDSTFLHSDPDTLLGFWLPLQDVNVDNGCIWGLPGSHTGKLYSRSLKIEGQQTEIREHEHDFNEADFIPLEMKEGSLLLFTGKFLHKSHYNRTNSPRYAYTWHLIDASSKWSSDNWLQRPSFPSFPVDRRVNVL